MKFYLSFFSTLILSFILSFSVFADVLSKKTIIEVAVNSGEFLSLVTALNAANLVQTLSRKGPFTVFVPTDDAFAKLPNETIVFLLKNTDKLPEVLMYQVVAGTRSPTSLIKEGKVKTLLGQDIEMKGSNRKVLVVNDTMVIASPIIASNGVLYAIDSVLIP